MSSEKDYSTPAASSKLFDEKKLLKHYLNVALPTVITTWLMFIFYFIDGIFVGRFVGTQALAALNLAMPILHLPYAFGVMVTVGAATRAAILIGKDCVHEASFLFTRAVIALLIVGTLFGCSFIFFSDQIAYLLGARNNIFNEVNRYLMVSGFFQTFTLVSYTFEAFLRLENFARIAMYAMSFAAVANIFLDYFFIVILRMGIVGSALATGITLSASGAMMLCFHLVRAKNLRFIYSWPRNFFKSIISISYLGISEFLSTVAPSVVMVAFNFTILDFLGESGLVAYSIVENVIVVGTMTSIALVESMQPMTSFFLGLGDKKLVWKSVRIGSGFILSFALLLTFVVFFFTKKISMIFLGDNFGIAWQHLESAVIWYGLALLPAGINLIVLGYLTAVQAPAFSALIAILRSWVLLLFGVWILPKFFGASAIWIVVFFSELLTLPVSILLLFKSYSSIKSHLKNPSF